MHRIFHTTRLYMILLLCSGLASFTSSALAANGHSTGVAEKILANIEQTTGIQEGKNHRVVYIFFDPNCPYCHRLYVNTRNWVRQNTITFRWIPVGILTTTSFGKAAAILDAKNPLKAFYRNEAHYAMKKGGGGIDETLALDKTENELNINAKVLNLSGSSAVPLMLFRATNGQAIMIHGAPPIKRLKQVLHYVK